MAFGFVKLFQKTIQMIREPIGRVESGFLGLDTIEDDDDQNVMIDYREYS